MRKEIELQCRGIDFACAVQGYAVRFLRYNNSLILIDLAEAPPMPDKVSDVRIQEMLWEDHFTEVWADTFLLLRTRLNHPFSALYLS